MNWWHFLILIAIWDLARTVITALITRYLVKKDLRNFRNAKV